MPNDLNRIKQLAGLPQAQDNRPIMINGKQVDQDSIELDIGMGHGGRDSDKDAASASRAEKASFKDGTELSDAELEMLNREYYDVIWDMAYDEIIGQDYDHLRDSSVTEKSNFFTDLRIARALDQMEFRNDKGELITITPEQRKKIINIVKQHGYSAELIDYFKKIGIPEYEPDEQHAEFLFKLDPAIRKKHKTVQDFMRSQDYLSRKAQSAPAKKKRDHFYPYTRAQYAQGIGDMQLRNRKGELTKITPEQIEQILDIIEVHGFGAELEKYLKKINVIGKYATVESLAEAPAKTITGDQMQSLFPLIDKLGEQLYRFSPRNPSPDKITGQDIIKMSDLLDKISERSWKLWKATQHVNPFDQPGRFEQGPPAQPVNSSVDNAPGGMNKNMPTDLNRMKKLAGLQPKPANGGDTADLYR